jgi:hypothetical protein
MNKRLSITVLVLVLVLSSVFLASCGSKSSIVGTWEGDLNTLKFNSDGSMTTSIFGIGTDGTYTFVDADTITISQFGVGMDYDFEIDGKTLYLKNSGFTLTYTKGH